MKVKVGRCIAAGLVLLAVSARGENRFDAAAKALAPIIAVATPNGSGGNHAFQLDAAIGEMSGAHVQIAFEFPDKLRVQFPLAGRDALICRNGNNVWAYPASLFAPIAQTLGGANASEPLPPFEIDAKKAVLLPALLDVHDSGTVRLAEQSYRVLDLRPIKEARGKNDSWPARIWIAPQNHRIAQFALRFSDWSGTFAVQRLEFSPALPAETWQPTAEQQSEVTPLPGDKFLKAIAAALKQQRATP